MANPTPIFTAQVPQNLNPQLDRMLAAYVEAGFDQAVLNYRANPSTDNWTAMKCAMLVYQQHRGLGPVARTHLHAKLAGRPFAEWDDLIVRESAGDSINNILRES